MAVKSVMRGQTMPCDEVNKAEGPIGHVVKERRTAGVRVGGHVGCGWEQRGPPYLDTGHCCQHYNQETRTL